MANFVPTFVLPRQKSWNWSNANHRTEDITYTRCLNPERKRLLRTSFPVFALTESTTQSLSDSCALCCTERKLLELSNAHATPASSSDNGELLFLQKLSTQWVLFILHKTSLSLAKAPRLSHQVFVVDRERKCMQCCFAYIYVQQKLLELSNLPTQLWIAGLIPNNSC